MSVRRGLQLRCGVKLEVENVKEEMRRVGLLGFLSAAFGKPLADVGKAYDDTRRFKQPIPKD